MCRFGFKLYIKKYDLILSRTYLSCAGEKKRAITFVLITKVMRLYIYFPCTYNMCVCVVRKKKQMIMFGQRVSEKIGIKTSSLYSFYVWNIVGNGKQLYPIIFIESFYVINCCLSCYKFYSFKSYSQTLSIVTTQNILLY